MVEDKFYFILGLVSIAVGILMIGNGGEALICLGGLVSSRYFWHWYENSKGKFSTKGWGGVDTKYGEIAIISGVIYIIGEISVDALAIITIIIMGAIWIGRRYYKR